jgi:hypothetical protein
MINICIYIYIYALISFAKASSKVVKVVDITVTNESDDELMVTTTAAGSRQC